MDKIKENIIKIIEDYFEREKKANIDHSVVWKNLTEDKRDMINLINKTFDS